MIKRIQQFYKKNEKYKSLMFIIFLAFLFTIGGTIAYYYQTITIPNKFKTMTYDVALEEEFYNDWGTKRVMITNNEDTSTPVVIRINYNEEWNLDDKTLNNLVNGSNVVIKTWSEEFLNNFTLNDDGWYYYNKVLNSKQSIEILKSISLDETLVDSSSDYNKADYKMTFNYEAIQASENAIKEIWGFDTSINGSEVTWQF